MKKKKMLSCILAISICLGIAGCSSKSNNNGKKGNEKEKITVVLDWTPNTNHTGLYIALEKGYFEDEGIYVEVKEPPEDGAAILVASGKAQFGYAFQEYLAPAFKPGEEMGITAVSSIIQHNTSGLVSLKDKSIETPADLENHSYASWDMDIEKAILKYLMEKYNADYSKLEIIPNTISDAPTALKTNQTDTIWIYHAWDGIAAEVQGLETNFIDFGEIDENLDFYSPVLIANNDYLENNEEDAKAFMRAFKRGYEYAIEHPQEAAEILYRLVPELDKEIIEKSQLWLADKYQDDAPYWGYIDNDRWDGFYKWLYDTEVIDYKIEAGIGFSNKYIEAE